uniref:Secreted protein n=1 Tax=Macrostomum lignano TaxID=282301 RepID=A0A1I8G9S3_9PLAT
MKLPKLLAFLLLLACSLTVQVSAEQCSLMPPNYRPARKNPGLYLSNSTVDARVCRYECSRIRPPPR